MRSSTCGGLCVLSALLAAGHAQGQRPEPTQEQLIELRSKQLASPVLRLADWMTDDRAARARAAAEGKLLFVYFTRSDRRWGVCEELETAAFADPSFPAFAARVVLLLRDTSQPADDTSRPADERRPWLHRRNGSRSFPSLAFLAADGTELGSPPGRDVAAFEAGLGAARAVGRLASKTDRDATGDAELFVARLLLGQLSLEEARAGRAAAPRLTAAQGAQADNEILLLEIHEVVREAGRDRARAYDAFGRMAEAGRTPTGARSFTFWYGVMTWAVDREDAELLASALRTVTAEFGARPGFERTTARFVDALAALERRGGSKKGGR